MDVIRQIKPLLLRISGYTFYGSLILSYVIFIAAEIAFAVPASPALSSEIEPSKNKVIKITDDGLFPPKLSLERGGSSIFFLNSTKASSVKIEIDYGKRLGFCATGAMEMTPEGILKSKSSLSPAHFTAVCFPEKGAYSVKVFGVSEHPQGLFADVIVEEGEAPSPAPREEQKP